MKKLFISIVAFAAMLVSTLIFCELAIADGSAYAAGRQLPAKAPSPTVENGQQPAPGPAHKAKFGPPIVVPWKRDGVYSMMDVQKALQTLGWWVSEAKNNSGQFYNPPKLELVAVDDEKWKVLKKDVHMQAAKRFGRSIEIKENEKDTPTWQHYLFRGGIEGVRAAVVDVIPRSAAH